MSRTTVRMMVLLGAMGLLAACGGSTADEGGPADRRSAGGAADPELGRVVVLGEEVLLADVLALGVTPVAASASVPGVGFQGIDEADTEGIEVLPMTELDLEQVKVLRPDLIVTYQFWMDQTDEALVTAMADTVVLPDGLSPEDQVTQLGTELDRVDEATDLVAELEAARAAARDQVGEGCEVSLATVYSGPSLAVWTDGPWAQPSAIMDLGCTLVPDAEEAPPESNGRAYLSEEQLELLAADRLVLLQNSTVEGEDQALEAMQANPLWAGLPAVEADAVVVLDRLGYPGATGLVRFLGDVADAVAPT